MVFARCVEIVRNREDPSGFSAQSSRRWDYDDRRTGELWGPLAAFLGHREVLIEHYSDSVSQAEFCGCLEKIAFASSRYFEVPTKHRGEQVQ